MQKYLEIDNCGEKLAAEICLAGNVKNSPCLILGHGLTGNRNERLLIEISKKLYDTGISSIRFDYDGHGESSGRQENVTIRKEVSDLLSVLHYAKSLPEIDASEIFIGGHSLGGLTAVLACAAEPEAFAGLVLLSPAFTLYHELIAGLTGDRLYRFIESGNLDLGGFLIGRALIDESAGTDGFAAAGKISPDALLIHGDNDRDTPPYNSVLLKQIWGEKAVLKLIPGADHCYRDRRSMDQVAAEISTYLQNIIHNRRKTL